MSKKGKRVILTPKKGAKNRTHKAVVYPSTYKKRGVEYFCYIVRGWQENGTWQRRQFKDEDKANEFAAAKNVELLDTGATQRLVLTRLDEDKIQEAEKAFKDLGEVYTLSDAVNYFLKNHRPPEFTIKVSEGLRLYLNAKVKKGIRPRSIDTIRLTLTHFARAMGDPMVKEITMEGIEDYLSCLTGKDNVTPVKYKTYNCVRAEIGQFLKWSMKDNKTTNRPWRFDNPVEKIEPFTKEQIAEQRDPISTTDPSDLIELFSYLMNYNDGALVKAYAIAYFAGVRPDGELKKLAGRELELINHKMGFIHLPADVAKTKRERKTSISPNLMAWLEAYKDKPIMPVNFNRLNTTARKHLKLKRDETRHSYVTYYVALHREVGDAALEAGNSEAMIRDHYLQLKSQEEGKNFFSIVPNMEKGEAVFSKQKSQEKSALKPDQR